MKLSKRTPWQNIQNANSKSTLHTCCLLVTIYCGNKQFYTVLLKNSEFWFRKFTTVGSLPESHAENEKWPWGFQEEWNSTHGKVVTGITWITYLDHMWVRDPPCSNAALTQANSHLLAWQQGTVWATLATDWTGSKSQDTLNSDSGAVGTCRPSQMITETTEMNEELTIQRPEKKSQEYSSAGSNLTFVDWFTQEAAGIFH